MDLLGSMGMPVHRAVPAQVYGGEPLWGQVVADLGQWEA